MIKITGEYVFKNDGTTKSRFDLVFQKGEPFAPLMIKGPRVGKIYIKLGQPKPKKGKEGTRQPTISLDNKDGKITGLFFTDPNDGSLGWGTCQKVAPRDDKQIDDQIIIVKLEADTLTILHIADVIAGHEQIFNQVKQGRISKGWEHGL